MEKELEKDLKKHEEKVADKGYKDLVSQIDTEFKISEGFISPKWTEWLLRLKLYNNQRRNKLAVGDPLLFTIHQTVLASLYDDKLAVEFLGRERGDEEQAENLGLLAEFDYDDMEKAEFDYEWDWDSSFFGRGIALFMEYDRETHTPIPEVVDPLTFYRDPRAVSVRGMRGKGALKFCGRETRMSKWEMRNAGVYDGIVSLDEIKNNGDKNSLVYQNQQARANAQGKDLPTVQLKGDNADFVLHEWFTHWNNKKVFVTLAEGRKKVIRIVDVKGKYFPLIDRAIYPMSHDWDGVSIPDMCEDKQRRRAKMLNLVSDMVEGGQYPRYLFDQKKIKNKAELAKYEFNKYIGVDGPPAGAIMEIQGAQVKQDVAYIMNTLDSAAQKATATPEIQQGAMSGEKRTASEVNRAAQGVDTRYSLSAKIFGWSERRFWQTWYGLYKEHFVKEIDGKVIRLSGSMGADWRKLTRDEIIASVDPDIKIQSKVLSDAKRMNELNIFNQFMTGSLAQDPSANKRYAIKHLAKLSGLSKDEVNRLLPKTFDEYEAEKENDMIESGKLPRVTAKQDHVTHLEILSRAIEGKAKTAHRMAHQVAMFLQRENPELIPVKGNPTATGQDGQITPSGNITEKVASEAQTLRPNNPNPVR